jgi:uncharacterized damage-inducible protein DinB
MLTDVLVQLYERDLGKLKLELELYSDDADVWRTGGEITNSAGNLALHLIGNLNHFIGGVLGGSGYVRDRDAEFSGAGIPKESLLADIEKTAVVVRSTFEDLTDADLAKDYPIDVFGHPMTTQFFLVHLATHLSYHLGQINYHRRLFGSK